MNESLIKSGNFILPEGIGSTVHMVDPLFWFIFIVSTILFVLIMGAMAYFTFRYRRSADNQKAEKQVTHNTTLEVAWTVIPLILVMIVFVWGYRGYLANSVAPADAYEIKVTGRKWSWLFEYPDLGIKSPTDIVVKVNTPVKLIMISEDVLHSFFLPNLRIKKDVLPNRYTTQWFTAEKVGRFQVFCTEFCGDQHSSMLANLIVLSEEDYDQWVQDQQSAAEADVPLDVLGKKIADQQGCFTCHSVDGTKIIGPTWKGIYDSNRPLVGGESVVADDNYLRESIVNPMAKIVEGYPPVMAPYTKLSDRELSAIAEYIKTLKD